MRCSFNNDNCKSNNEGQCDALDDTRFDAETCPFFALKESLKKSNGDYEIIRTSSGCRRVTKGKL